MFCKNCGSEISDKAVVCIKCGVPVTPICCESQNQVSNERIIVLLLCFFLGGLGVHRFYTKNIGIAISQLLLGILSCGLISWIWAIVDFVILLSGNYKTGDGRVLR